MRLFTLTMILFLSIASYSQKGYIFKDTINDELSGFASLNGEIILPNEYINIKAVQEYILAMKTAKKGQELYTQQGDLISKKVSDFFSFGNSRFILVNQYKQNSKGKWALYSLNGERLTKFIYDDVVHSTELPDFATVVQMDKYILIDTLGQEIISASNKTDFKNKLRSFVKEENVVEEEFLFESSFGFDCSNDPDVFQDKENLKFGLKQGDKIIVQAKYDELQTKCCDLCVVKLNSKYGVITNNDRLILRTEYDKIDNIAYDKIIAIIDGKYGVYDGKTGKTIVKPTFKYLKFLYQLPPTN